MKKVPKWWNLIIIIFFYKLHKLEIGKSTHLCKPYIIKSIVLEKFEVQFLTYIFDL